MGKKDIITKKYLSDNERFADVFNYFVYNGRKVILPDMLSDNNAEELAALNKNDKNIFKQSVRDILKICTIKNDNNNTYILLGAETQSDVHYAMPVKNWLYDALNYAAQVGAISKEHHKKRDLKGAEFLSGFAKDDKIKPIITLTVYFGTDDWDGPLSLHDMLDTDDEEVLKYVEDYKINLIVLKDIPDSEKFSTDFREVADFIKVAGNKKALKELMKSRGNEFAHMDSEAALLIKECANVKIEIDEREDKTNMCKAIDDMIEDAREEVRQEMQVENIVNMLNVYKEVGIGKKDALSKIMEKNFLPPKDIVDIVETNW